MIVIRKNDYPLQEIVIFAVVVLFQELEIFANSCNFVAKK